MNWINGNAGCLKKWALLLIVMAIPAFAGQQQDNKKTTAPKQSAPPPKPAAQPQQHPAAPQQKPSPVPQKAPSPVPPKAPAPRPSPVPPKPSPEPPKSPTTPPNGPSKSPREVKLPSGGSAQIGADGRIRSIDKNGMHIEHSLHGGRTVVSERNGVRVVTTRNHQGYVQRAYVTRGGHTYYSRTYYEHGVARSVVYRGYVYGGHTYYAYYPSYYYRPAFYAWAYNPWPGPLYWDAAAWGWGGAPWYGYYAFTPYPYYAGPSYWLTDYLIAANLKAAYVEAGVGGTQVVVPGNQTWTDTGTFVSAGQEIVITASGGVSMGAGWPLYPPAGKPPHCDGGGFPAGELPCWSLIGRVGDGPIFYVGNGTRLTATNSGQLFLGVNDNIVADNTGSWVANIGIPATPAVADGSQVDIPGNQPWTDTGTLLNAGETVTINASGGVSMSSGAAPLPPSGPAGPIFDAKAQAPSLPCYSLIARIGPAGVPFYVGNAKTFVVPVSGELFLGVNDGYFPDNSGDWFATVRTVRGGDSFRLADQLGTRWIEEEAGIPGTWTRRGTSDVFDGVYPTIGLATTNRVSLVGNKVFIARTNNSDGNPCSYEGAIGPDGITITGSYTCRNYGSAQWKATVIRDVAPANTGGPAPTGSDAVSLKPEVKQAISEEVKAQLQAEQAAAGQTGQNASANTQPSAPARDETPPALDPARRTFIVNTDLAVDAGGQECSLTSGDVLMRLTDTPDANQKVNASVTSSKKNDCKAGDTVAVSVNDLQEMQNHFREQLDGGMAELASKQGTGKMPKAPDTSTVASDIPPPQPDSGAEKMLQEQQAAADQTETQVKQETAGGSAGGQQ